ncbi:MAG: hypothetical protein ACKOCM_12795 [Cyanobacteriota bacterium]
MGAAVLVMLVAAEPVLAAPGPKTPGKAKGPTASTSQERDKNNGRARQLAPQINPATQIGNGPGQVHRLTDQLNALGAVNCLARAEQIAHFLDPGNTAGTAVMPLGTYPHQRLVVANLAIPLSDGRESLAIITMAPNQVNGCGGGYQLMTVEPGNCIEALRARQAEPQGAVPLVGKNIRIQRLAQDSVFLGWQLKESCLIVKQQSLLNAVP